MAKSLGEMEVKIGVDHKALEKALEPASDLVNGICNAAMDAACDTEVPVDRVTVDCGYVTVTFDMGRARVR